MATEATIKFSITFDVLNGLMTFTDITSGHGSGDTGVVKITYLDDGTIIKQSDDWLLEPANWSAPDIDGSTSTWAIEDIPLPTVPNGSYLFEYKFYDGLTMFTVTREFELNYTAPEVAIDLSMSCSTSELTLTDSTNYAAVFDNVSVDFTTMSRTKTLTKPAGSGCMITPLTWTDTGSTPSVTVGGGATEDDWIWTKVWQANIVTALVYNPSTWDSTEPTIYVTDTVYGDDNINVQCDATICALATCYSNLLDRWIASLSGNWQYRDDKRDIIIQASALWNKLNWYERCGESTESTILALQTLLAGENCNCTTNNDAVSQPVTPWAHMVGVGGGDISLFTFTIINSDPNDLNGNDGDVHVNNDPDSWHVFQKTAGHWVDKGTIKGDRGASGITPTTGMTPLLNDPTVYATAANTLLTAISYDFKIGNSQFTYNNDYMEITWEVLLARNQNGKLITVNFAGTDIFSYFTDDLVNSNNDRLTIKLKVEPITVVQQHLYCTLIRNGKPGEVVGPVCIRNNPMDLNTPRSVQLYATNSVASAADVSCDLMTVEVYHTDQTLISGGIALSVGRGLVAQAFTATEGQMVFEVTLFELNDFYIPLIDNVPQSQLVVTRSGQFVTYLPGLSEGQVLLIVD